MGEENHTTQQPQTLSSADTPQPQTATAAQEGPSTTPRRSLLQTLSDLFRNTNQLLRTLIILALVLILATGLYTLQQRAHHNKVVRTFTQTVTEIKNISEFCTATYQEETVVTARRKKLVGTDDLVLIVKGTVRVGFDLSQMQATPTSDTSVVIDLPAPIVLDILTNPSDIEIFEESGQWPPKQVASYKNLARSKILHHAKADGIMDNAVQNGTATIEKLFHQIGFSQVTVRVAKPQAPSQTYRIRHNTSPLPIPPSPDPAI